jgi:hypothetical protein
VHTLHVHFRIAAHSNTRNCTPPPSTPMRGSTATRAPGPTATDTILALLQLIWCIIIVVLGTLHTCDVYVVSNFSAVWGFLTAASGTLCALVLVPCLVSMRRKTDDRAKMATMFSTVGRTILGVFLLKSTLTISTQGWEASDKHLMVNGRMTLAHHNFTFTETGTGLHVVSTATSASMETLATFVRLSVSLNSEINQIINVAFLGIAIIIVGHVAVSELMQKQVVE